MLSGEKLRVKTKIIYTMKKLEKIENFKSKKLSFEAASKINGGIELTLKTGAGEMDYHTGCGCLTYTSDSCTNGKWTYYNASDTCKD